MEYIPKMYESLNLDAGTYSPSTIKPYNNETYIFWCRSLFQRLASKIELSGWPSEWDDLGVKDFFYFILLRNGYLGVYNDDKLGTIFGPCTIGNVFNWAYQPTTATFCNPETKRSVSRKINKECGIVKLTPDYIGVYDIVKYFAEKLALNDPAVNTSIINSKLANIFGGKTKAAIQMIKAILDDLNKGEPAAFYKYRVQDDPVTKDSPFQMLKLFSSTDFITDKLLATHQTIIDQFDAEIGIQTIPYNKKERMVESEAESKEADSQSRISLWIRTLNESLKIVNRLYGLKLHAYIRKEDTDDGKDNTVRNGDILERSE